MSICKEQDGPYPYLAALEADMEILDYLASKEWEEQYEKMHNLSFARLSAKKDASISENKKECVKRIRDEVKKELAALCKKYYGFSKETIMKQMEETAEIEKTLIDTVLLFGKRFEEKKRQKNILDFQDMEHLALNILIDRKTDPETGEKTWKPSKVAQDYSNYFREIMIDEYQDSNLVQEYLLQSISGEYQKRYNRFMVGDLKQSIYKFRLARPEIFLEKYHSYSEEDDAWQQRVDLHKNFRSRRQVIDSVNHVFYRIMGEQLGKIEYTEKEALYPGAEYPEGEDDYTTELLLLENEGDETKKAEAAMIADRIHQLVGKFKVKDKETGEMRTAKYGDIVVLLRSNSGWDEEFCRVFMEQDIPACVTSKTGYFTAKEVQILLSFLKTIDNPKQDIPLYGTMKSLLGRFNDEEIAHMKSAGKGNLYENLKAAAEEESGEKAKGFLEKLERYLNMVYIMPIHKLLRVYLKETGYLHYFAAMTGGEGRVANVKMLLEKAENYEKTSYFGLFHFIRYMEQLQKYDIDAGESGSGDESADAVRIMSIHKSKGLEFPIVFVSGMGKNFNKQDTRNRMVLHPEYGLGLDAMDGRRRIKAPTIAKAAIAKQIELENLGEELRVLYVALTRAKEKLILTGSKKDIAAKVEICAQEVSGYEYKNGDLLPYLKREGAASYLDWVLPALLSYGEKYPITLVTAEELVTEEVEKQVLTACEKTKRMIEIEHASEELLECLETRFSNGYPYEIDETKKNKYSVSELKHRAMREAFEAEDTDSMPIFAEEAVVPYVPKFVRELEADSHSEEELCQTDTEVNRGALRGTAVHRVMECYDFASESSPKEQLEKMQKAGRITKELSDLVQMSKVQTFIDSETGLRMKKAALSGKLYREKPFVMSFSEEDMTLIQGIIDVFWMEEDGIVLLDYKTDSVAEPKELVLRYEEQLNLYAEALNRVFVDSGLKVKEKLIYAFKFDEVIAV